MKVKTLKVCDIEGKYHSVSFDEIFRASSEAIEKKFARSHVFTAPEVAQRFCREKLAGRDSEVFAVLFLDTRHRMIEYREMFFGTIDGSEVHPREVVKAALELNAAAIIMTHNHPSGNTDPSAADRAVTTRLKQALALIDVRTLDHIVVAGNNSTSMASLGWV